MQWWLAGLINSDSLRANSTHWLYRMTIAYTEAIPSYTGNSMTAMERSARRYGHVPTPMAASGFIYSFLNKNFQVAIEHAGNQRLRPKCLSAPSLFSMNNQPAQITVGTQVPVISQSFRHGLLDDRSTGTPPTVSVRPSYISTGVSLVDHATRQSGRTGLYGHPAGRQRAGCRRPEADANPPISQRNLATQVAVQSGADRAARRHHSGQYRRRSRTGVPMLSSIPILGNLFGNTSKTHDRTELIMLITPRVVGECRRRARDDRGIREEIPVAHADPSRASAGQCGSADRRAGTSPRRRPRRCPNSNCRKI